MMKTSKKFLALLLSLTMVAFALAGCSGGGSKDTTDTDSNKSTTAPTEAAATQPTEAPATPTPVPEKFAAFDFGGKTIKVGTWYDIYYTSDHTKIEDNPALGNTETAQMQLDNVRRIEAKYNCKIQYVNMAWSGIMSSIQTSIAAGTPDCDIYMVDLQFGLPAVYNGLAQDLTNQLPANSDLLSTDHNFLVPCDMGSVGGMYLFQERQVPVRGLCLGYNATMIQDLGLEDPQELYANGQWTWEKFAELAKAGTKDTNNDGVTDVYGYGSVFTETPQGFFLSNGANLSGNRTEGLSSPQAIETIEFLDRLYTKDKSARPFSSDFNGDWFAWSSGKVMFWTGQPWAFDQEIKKAIDAGSELPFEFHIVPFPKGPSATDDIPRSPLSGNWYMVPIGVKDTDKLLTIMEEYFSWHQGNPEYRDDLSFLEGCYLSQEDVDIEIKCGSTLVFDPWTSLSPYFDFNASVIAPVINDQSQTVAQAVEAAKASLQSALDNYVYKNAK